MRNSMRRMTSSRHVKRSTHRLVQPQPLDLNYIVNKSLADMAKGSFLQDTVTKRVEETIKNVVGDVFGSYSAFSKNLEKAMKQGLLINIDKLSIPEYNALLLGQIDSMIQDAINKEGLEKIKKAIDDMLVGDQTKYKLSEIIERIKKDAMDDEDISGGEMTLVVETKYSHATYIYIDIEEDKEYYRCKYEIAIDKESKVSWIKVDDDKFERAKIMGSLFGIDRFLFRLFAIGAEIELDVNDCDLYIHSPYED